MPGLKQLQGRRSWLLRLVEMPDIMLRRVLRAAPVELFPHAVLDRDGIGSLADNIVLMEYVAEEMPVIKPVKDRAR